MNVVKKLVALTGGWEAARYGGADGKVRARERKSTEAASEAESPVTTSLTDVVAVVRDLKLDGRGIVWIDVHLLVSAVVARLERWTTDPVLATVAKELGISYE